MRSIRFPVRSPLFAALPLLATPLASAATEPVVLESAEAAFALAEARDPVLRALDAEAQVAEAARRADRALPNPEAEASLKRGRGGDSRQWEFAVKGDVGALLAAPWSYGEAGAKARAARLRVENARAERRFEIEAAWYRAVAAEALRSLEAEGASTREAEAELARRMRAAGTLNALDLAESEAAAAQARVASRRAEREADGARADLARATGAPDWILPGALPEPPAEEASGEAWNAAARARNPALATERAELDAARRSLTRARLASLPGLRAGMEFEGGDGPVAAGPVVAVEIPLFDLGFGRRAKARGDVALAERRREASEATIAPQSGALHALLLESRAAHAAWKDTVLPLREAAAAEALRHYNFMLVGADRLMAARREVLAARRAATESLRDYWLARAALRHLAGGEVHAAGGDTQSTQDQSGEEATPNIPPAEKRPSPFAPETKPHQH